MPELDFVAELGKELDEQAAAQKIYDDLVAAGLSESARVAAESSAELATVNRQKAELFESIRDDVDDIQRINHSFTEQLKEGFVGIFKPGETRVGKAQNIKANQSRLQILDEQQQAARAQRLAKQREIEIGIAKGEARLRSESADVERIQTRFAAFRQAFQQERLEKDRFFSRASDEEINEAVASGKITAFEGQNELRRRRASEVALSSSEEALRKSQLSELLSGGSEEDLAAAAKKGLFGATPELVRKELQGRKEGKRIARAGELQLGQAEIAALERSRGLMLTQGMLDSEVEALLTEAQKPERGGQVVMSNGMTFTAPELAAELKTRRAVVNEQVTATVSTAIAKANIKSQADQLGRLTGLSVKQGDVEDGLLQSVIDSPYATSDAKQAATILLEANKAVKTGQLDTLAEAGLLTRATEAADTVLEAERQRRIAQLPKEQQDAASEYYSSQHGMVANQGNALASFAAAVAAGGTLGSPVYDSVVSAIDELLTDPNKFFTDEVAQKLTVSITDKGLEQAVATLLKQPTVRQHVLGATFHLTAFELYKQTLSNLGYTDDLEAVKDPTSPFYVDGKFSDKLLVRVLGARELPDGGGTALSAFLQRLQQESTQFAHNAFTPGGPSAHIQASINKALLNNQAVPLFVANVSNHMDRVRATIAAEERVKGLPPGARSGRTETFPIRLK